MSAFQDMPLRTVCLCRQWMLEHQQLRDVMHRYGAETPAFVCPVRDLPAKDLALLCHYKRCPVLAPLGRPPRARDKPSINRISAEFVAAMQAALPSTVPTVLRTASKLKVDHLASPNNPLWQSIAEATVAIRSDQGPGKSFLLQLPERRMTCWVSA